MSLKNGKKKWVIIITAVVLVAVIVIGTIASNMNQSQSVETQGTIAAVEKRTIANSISGNGTVEAATKEDVTGGSMGMEVKSVNVEAGDVVAIGDIICVFDTSDQEERIADLQEQIVETEENRVEQNAEYDQQQLEAVTSQQTQYANLSKNLKSAKETLKKEKEILQGYQDQRDALLELKDKIEKGESAEKTIAEIDAEILSLDSAIREQKTVVNNAQNRVDNYQAQIDALLEQDNYIYVEAKEENDAQAEETTKALNEQIEEYSKQIEEATIRANMAGVVTSVNVSVGTTFTGGTIASIEAVDDFIVEAQIEEYDIPDIETGMKVLIKTDATRDAELEGIVTYVAPRATNSGTSSASGLTSLISGVDTSSLSGGSGSATYLVKIALVETNERLRLGMNAKVSIITEEKVDTWSVPYDAVYTRNDGTAYVERVTGKDDDGNVLTEELNIEIGIQGTYYIEILSSEITDETQILIPDAQGNSSIEELLNMMGADAGI